MVIDITSMVPLLTSVSFVILLLVLLRAEKNRTNRAFSYYILANIIWSFGSFMMHLNSPIFSPLFWNRFMVSALLIIPMFYYDFACKYTLQQNKLKNFNIFAYILLEILNLSGLIVSQARFQGNSFIYEPGDLILVAYGIDYGIMVLAALTLIVSYRKEENLSRKIGLRYVLTGSFVLMAGTLANLSSALGAYPIDIFSNLINALLIAYAIFRFKFVRVRKIARKFIAYVLTMFLVILLLTVATYAVAYFLYHNTLTNSTITIKIYHILVFVFLVTLIASFIFEPIREFLEQNIFKPPHLIEKKIKTSIERYLTCDTISKFSDFYIDDLKLITNCEDAYTYFYDRAEDSFICLDSSKKGLSSSISGSSMLVEYFKKSNKPIFASYLDILPEFTGITQKERQFIETEKIGLISPLSYKGEVLGISLLKVDEGYFVEDPEILDYLDNLNSNINIILKNLMLIENLTQINREMEAIRGRRDLFFAKMSHDIRNYITVIVQASNMLLS